MIVYRALGRLFPKSYVKKVFSAAFVGVHVPLMACIAYVLGVAQTDGLTPYQTTLLWLAVATVVGTGLTWWALHALLSPLFLVERSIARYEQDGIIEPLPERHQDEVGRLMSQINRLVFFAEHRLDGAREEAHTDPLTGLLNRRGFEARFPTHYVHGELFVIDLNQFKAINDQFGHAIGDAVLCHVASVLRAELRLEGDRFDLACRWGGDEFVVFVREVDLATANQIHSALGTGLFGEIWLAQHCVSVACAIGRVRWTGAQSLAHAIAEADRQMYADKQRTCRRTKPRPWTHRLPVKEAS